MRSPLPPLTLCCLSFIAYSKAAQAYHVDYYDDRPFIQMEQINQICLFPSVHQSEPDGMRPEMLAYPSNVSVALIEAGLTEPAWQLAQQIELSSFDSERTLVLSTVVSLLAESQQCDRAVSVAQELHQLVDNGYALPDYFRYNTAYISSSVTQCLAATGQYQDALGFVQQYSEDRNSYIQSLSLLVEAMIEQGDSNLALETVQTVSTADIRDFLSAQIAIGLAEAGEVDRALSIVEQLHKDSSAALEAIAKALVEAGNAERALAITRLIPPQEDSYESIAIAFIKAGEVEQALHLIWQIEPDYIPSESLVSELAYAQQYQTAIALANEIVVEDTRISALANVAIVLLEAGQIEQAFNVLNQALTLNGYTEIQPN